MANDYCTAQEVRATITQSGLSVVDDALLTTLATRASRAIDTFVGRDPGEFYVSADTTRYFDGRGEDYVSIYDCASVTTVYVDESLSGSYTTWTLDTDYMLWPDNISPKTRIDVNTKTGSKAGIPAGRRTVKVTGKFGYSTAVPDDVKQATIAQVTRWLRRGLQGYADAGIVLDTSIMQFVQTLDPEVKAILSSAAYSPVSTG